jgi:hypothetical protein
MTLLLQLAVPWAILSTTRHRAAGRRPQWLSGPAGHTAAAPVAHHAQPIAHDQKGTVMSNAANSALTGPWQDLWNGDLSVP